MRFGRPVAALILTRPLWALQIATLSVYGCAVDAWRWAGKVLR